ncbi:MAG TPA: VIT domain-containing protein [Streptosporangiaceae bacterium]|nr:VIT domain-containing protein [Streptosporangiaceae bacterium]
MTVRIAPLPDRPQPRPDAGLGALTTGKGNLPLDVVDVRATITGLAAGVEVTQGYRNPFDEPLEATYVFPLPDRAAVTGLRMEAADRVIEGVLKERGEARRDYDDAIAAGKRAGIAEEDRPDVFTMRVGNILPGERVTVRLTLDQPLPYEDGGATFRFPLVVAPRYIPGTPLDDVAAGTGTAPDTDAVPDASRISPPVLLPGFPNPVRLSLSARIDPAGLPLTEIRSALHVVATDEPDEPGDAAANGPTTVRLEPGERLDRDFVLRLGFAATEASTLSVTPDASRDEAGAGSEGGDVGGDVGGDGTFTVTVVHPPAEAASRPRDVVLVMDRSGSMAGWKIVAARRAAARIVDTLSGADRFAVLSFDHEICTPPELPSGLVAATDRHRFRAVEHLAGLAARGGTEMLAPLRMAAHLLADSDPADRDRDRDRVLVLITDGQIGNEDQILRSLVPALAGVRVHTVGIDRAVNAGFLHRLAAAGAGRAELVESEDRLDEAMEHIHHRIAAPLVTGLSVSAEGLDLVPDTLAPGRLGAIFPGVPLVVRGRYRGTAGGGSITLSGVRADGTAWRRRLPATVTGDDRAATAIWARAHLRELEDRYVADGSSDPGGLEELERRIVDSSLRFGVLCRFTAFVAVDTRAATSGGVPHQVIQPVEVPAGWAAAPTPTFLAASAAERPVAEAAYRRPLRPHAAGRVHRGSGVPPAAPAALPPTVSPAPASGPAAAVAAARRRLAAELTTLQAAAGSGAAEPERRRLLVELRDRLAALLGELRAAGADDRLPAGLPGLPGLLTDLTAWLAADDPADAIWDRVIRDLTAATTAGRAFWRSRP